jgi:hypothetical protein
MRYSDIESERLCSIRSGSESVGFGKAVPLAIDLVRGTLRQQRTQLENVEKGKFYSDRKVSGIQKVCRVELIFKAVQVQIWLVEMMENLRWKPVSPRLESNRTKAFRADDFAGLRSTFEMQSMFIQRTGGVEDF